MYNTNGTVYTTLHKDISGAQALRVPQETKLGNAALSVLVENVLWILSLGICNYVPFGTVDTK